MKLLCLVLMAGMSSALLFPAPVRAQNQEAAGAEVSKHIRSLKEIREEDVTKQRWDMSCGAAALSTLLTYDFKDRTPETSIVVWLLHRLDANRVRARGGFSLLDLKHFAEARGYSADGYSGMTIKDLVEEKNWVIVPIHAKGVDHFIVVEGFVDGHAVIADPGFGNMTMRVDKFEKLWKGGIVFEVHPPNEKMIPETKTVNLASHLLPDETAISRRIGVTAPTNWLY